MFGKVKYAHNNPLVKPVVQYTIDGVFVAEYKTISEASKNLNIDRSNITKCCKGKYKNAGGFIFKYKIQN